VIHFTGVILLAVDCCGLAACHAERILRMKQWVGTKAPTGWRCPS